MISTLNYISSQLNKISVNNLFTAGKNDFPYNYSA